MNQVTLIGGLGVDGARSYEGFTGEIDRLKLWHDSTGYMNDIWMFSKLTT